ncbi:MAG: hypothetical protein E7255_01955 [Lachnospiraceae bacterium]|jgi:hypothetical protein|nr:hypothetical protein [Lachnospiraceae bacterium]
MEWKLNPNAVNQLTKGTVIFTEGEPVFSIALVIKGRVLIHNDGAKMVVSTGAFLGVNDLYTGKFQSTYTALDELFIYAFPVNQNEELEQIFSINSDYHGFMVASNNRTIYDLNQIYQGMRKHFSGIYEALTESYKEYLDTANRRGYRARTSDRFEELYLPEYGLELMEDRIQYYIECRALPMEVIKAFYSYGNAITLYQVNDQAGIINQLIGILKEQAKNYISLIECLFDDTETCFFQLIAGLALEINRAGGDNQEFLSLMDRIKKEVYKADDFVKRMIGLPYSVDRKRMEEIYSLLLTDTKETEAIDKETFLKYSKEDSERAIQEMENSFQKIMDYAEIGTEKADSMMETMLDFINLRDRGSSDNDARLIRRNVTVNHYEIYMKVFLKAYKTKQAPKIIELFLKYGYADERLLTNEQLLSLYFLKETPYNGLCGVYNIKEWLTLIYEGRKDPSKNEFDMEYPEYVRSLRKQGKLTEEEGKDWLVNPIRKVEYEIQNMFRYNNRTTNGQISIFVPVLHRDMLANDFDRIHVTPEKINATMEQLLAIDYSVFDHEVIYSNEEKKIIKEYIIKRVYPDVILMPTIGCNGIMWQEITGKKRDTSGRFLFPIFTDTNLTSLMVKVFGRFRWEMCRTIEGTAWNDIKHKSLTSEYSDYLQFYRKNKELSEERKEKLKNQIQKGRNNSREIFVIDYEQWINYEAKGAIKLNKPVREMLATYCPFAKEIRERLEKQPLFEEAMARYNRDKLKKIREVESRHRLLEKERIEVVPELLATLNYYKQY